MAGASATVVSATRGRLRLKVTGSPREVSAILRGIQTTVDGDPPMSVQTNARTGSALVTFDPDELTPEDAIELLRSAHQALADLLSPRVQELLDRTASQTARAVWTRMGTADRRVFAATRGTIDLRMLVPVTLATLSLRNLLRSGPQLAKMPWYMLAYYSFDTFHKLHRGPGEQRPATPSL